jgi:hypothetical protein
VRIGSLDNTLGGVLPQEVAFELSPEFRKRSLMISYRQVRGKRSSEYRRLE